MGILGFTFDYVAAIAVLTPLLLLGHHFRARIGMAGRIAWSLLAASAGLIWCVRVARIMHARVTDPQHWDFLNFWLYGQLIRDGKNIYDVASYVDVAMPVAPDPEHTREALEVACVYPPISSILWAPLGWFEFGTALTLWYVVSVTALLAAAWWLTRSFARQPGWTAFGLVALFILLLRPSVLSFDLAQSQFLFLLAAVLFWHFRDRMRGGVALACAITLKPLAILFTPWLILQRRWRALAGLAIGLGIASVASLAILGPDTFIDFFISRPTGRLPYFVYTQDINQSLIAVALRWLSSQTVQSPVLAFPPYVIASGTLIGTALLAAWRDRTGRGWGLLALMLATLVVYPGATRPYAVLCALPAAALWRDRASWPGSPWSMAALLTLVLALHAAHPGDGTFLANMVLFTAVAVRAFGLVPDRVPATASPRRRVGAATSH